MARHHYYGHIISVEREGLTPRQEDALVARLGAGAVDDGHKISAWNLAYHHKVKVHGRVFGSLHWRGLLDGVEILINDDWNNAHSWWLTKDGVEVAQEIKKRRESG